MNSIFTIALAAKSETLNSNSGSRFYKQNMFVKVYERKALNPNQLIKQIAKDLGISDSTVTRYRDDNHMDSP